MDCPNSFAPSGSPCNTKEKTRSAVEIIGLPQRNFVGATRIVLAEKGAAHNSIPMPPNSPDGLAIHL